VEKKISIIIPVYNDASRIEKLLNSITKLNYDKDQIEVIVADNASTDKVKEIALKYNAIYFFAGNKKGPDYARNEGVRIAQGSYIAFTDSDCIVDPDWLSEAEKILDNGAGAVGGKIKFTFEHDKPSIIEYVDSVRHLNQEQYVNEGFSATANFIIKKEIFNKIGLFGEDWKLSGDYEFGKRMQKEGYKILYGDKAVVFHEARKSFLGISKKTVRIATGQKLLKKSGLWKENRNIFYQLMPRKKIPRNENYYKFNFAEKLAVVLIFNYLHFLNVLRRIL
jgi:glycosyltransferase involved in cell wall biosynthesis